MIKLEKIETSELSKEETQLSLEFIKFYRVMKALRNPEGGCPWDLEQTHSSLKPYLIEESYEVLDAIDEGDENELCKELGDVLMQIFFHAQVANDNAMFDMGDVLKKIYTKMVTRHPHVFGDAKVQGTEDVLKNWEAIKSAEKLKEKNDKSLSSTKQSSEKSSEAPRILEGIPRAMPALTRAHRMGEKAAHIKFDWQDLESVIKKLEEEKEELFFEFDSLEKVLKGLKKNKNEIKEISNNINDELHQKYLEIHKRIKSELGDVLFCISQIACWLGFNAEDALHDCCKRFAQRMKKMEDLAGLDLGLVPQEELEELWVKAKKLLN